MESAGSRKGKKASNIHMAEMETIHGNSDQDTTVRPIIYNVLLKNHKRLWLQFARQIQHEVKEKPPIKQIARTPSTGESSRVLRKVTEKRFVKSLFPFCQVVHQVLHI